MKNFYYAWHFNNLSTIAWYNISYKKSYTIKNVFKNMSFVMVLKTGNLINLLLVLVVLALMLPAAASCKIKEDGYMVQVWQPSAAGEPEELLAYGVVVDDGNHVLTVMDYEDYTPGKLLVVSPEYGQFNAIVQAIDYRTSATLLQLDDANLPAADIGNIPLSSPGEVAEQGKRYVDEPGAAITDEDGRVIGIVGRYWSKLIVIIGGPGGLQPKPGAIDINSAMELLIDSNHSNGPAFATVLTHSGNKSIAPWNYSGNPDDFKAALTGLLDKLGEPAPLDELAQYSSGFLLIPQTEEGITILMASFTYPVELHDTTGALIANAKWVGIQWDRNDGKPNRLIYGSTPYIPDGSYRIEGDISNLMRIIEPALLE
jgi:hypothetical protein